MGGSDGKDTLGDIWYSSPLAPQDAGSPAGPAVLVNKTVSPASIKQGKDIDVTIILANTGTARHRYDIRLLEGDPRSRIPVTGRRDIVHYPAGSLMPGGSRLLRYTVQATTAGRYTFPGVSVMYAGEDGNAHDTSNAPVVTVLASLIPGDQAPVLPVSGMQSQFFPEPVFVNPYRGKSSPRALPYGRYFYTGEKHINLGFAPLYENC